MTIKEYFLPESLDEAVSLLDRHGPSLLVMAGGTLAMPLINEGVSMPERVMGLRRAGLDTISRSNGVVSIGATVTLTQLRSLGAIPMLQEAAGHIGGWAIRNMGTVGGNLFAPPPAGDLAVALLALDASLRLVRKGSERIVPLNGFFTDFMMTALEPGEIVAEIHAPVPAGKTAYIKFGRKAANTPAIVTVAALAEMAGGAVTKARVALNGVGPHPFRATGAEDILTGSTLDEASIAQAAAAAAQASQPFTDAIASEWYRRKMVDVYVRRALAALKA